MKTNLICTSLVLSFSAFSQYYQTLPKGVRTFIYKNVTTNNVDSTFNPSGSKSSLTFEVKATTEMLSQIEHPIVQETLAQLAPYADAASLFSLGSYRGGGSADIKVDAYAFGYGITNKLTAYAALPVYDAKVKVNYERTQQNTYDQVAAVLQEYVDDTTAQAIGSNLYGSGQIFDFDAAVLQSIFVNQLGYEPLGDWRGHGLGDMELGLVYNFFTNRKFGLATTVGAIAPTGRIDDPNIIQDFGFGDGQWDIFAELGVGYHLTNTITLNSYVRYTHQFATDKELRRPSTREFKHSSELGVFNEKLGDKMLFHVSSDYDYNDWLSFTAGYEYDFQGQSEYNSRYGVENDYLAYETDSSAHNLRLSANFSSVKLFKQKKFVLPGNINLKTQHMITGTNRPKVHLYELEFRMFF